MEKSIYKIDDYYKVILHWILRIVILGILIAIGTRFNENPPVISIVILLGLGFIFIIREYSLLLYEDHIVYRKKYWGVIFKDKKYYFENIESIDLHGEYTLNMILLENTIPGEQFLPSNTIEITFSNGEKEEIDLYVLKSRLAKFLKYTLEQLDKYKKLKTTYNNTST